tara:strand:+ start:556 stop:897 length:342 start_codon:yes stop_codon:yes gene_type:complete
MKFWQLDSVCRECPEILESVLREPRWSAFLDSYRNLDELVDSQCRERLDQIVPDELAVSALQLHKGKLYLSRGHVRRRRLGLLDKRISYLEVYRRFGGEFLEDVIEYGLVRIP